MATVLAFHAHPDDEVLLTGGTIARAYPDHVKAHELGKRAAEFTGVARVLRATVDRRSPRTGPSAPPVCGHCLTTLRSKSPRISQTLGLWT